MSDYKSKIDQLKAFFLGLEAKDEVKEEVALEEDMVEEVKEEAAPAPTYVTAEHLSQIKDEIDGKLSDMAEMLQKFAEMVSATEKNTVPADLSEVEVVEEEVELSEQAPEPVKHDPESLKSEPVKFQISAGRKKGTEDVVFDALAKSGLWSKS